MIDYWSWFYTKHIVRALYAWYLGEKTFIEVLYSHWSCMWVFNHTVVTILLMVGTAALTLHERSVIADIQFRKGPRKIGSGGILQPISDAFKLIAKEHISPIFLMKYMFEIASVTSFTISAFFWFIIPLGAEIITCADDYGLFWIFNLSIFHVFCIIMAGWSSYSKYSNLGSYRTAAQLLSYELVVGIVYSSLFNFVKDLNIISYVESQFKIGSFSYFLPGLATVFFISLLAESCRHPFDLPEAEAELVSGYNVEYSSIWFAMFFLSEYLNVIYSAFLLGDMFFGQSDSTIFYIFKGFLVIYAFILIRALIPRYRYDHLMSLNWKYILPILSAFLFYFVYLQNYVL